MSDLGASAAYRGYRLQALYVLKRVLSPRVDPSIIFRPEGKEDLDIESEDGTLIETIQVKSYNNLVLSDLTPDKANSFFRRALRLLHIHNHPDVKLVNFGRIGDELRLAWKEDGKHRERVFDKLKGFGYSHEDIQMLFDCVGLKEVVETTEKEVVFTQLREQLTGVDPANAFNLLNFWLYIESENGSRLTREDLIQQIQDVGHFLSDRYHYHREWFTSIQPIEDTRIEDERISQLREEFYVGVSTRYEHILADLDFRRDEKLTEISQAFDQSKIVIIHAASGQGKSALAYRYLHDTYPEQWRFSISVIEDRQHALSISRALSGHARAVQVPMAIYIDVAPTDPDWAELVRQLAHEPYFQILVTIREEDFRRTNISNAFEFIPIDLTLREVEARQIFERARKAGYAQDYLNFEDAWHIFGGRGPLLEFVYLLTQTQTLHQRLEEQVKRIRRDVREMSLAPDELELLRLVSTASAYDARIKFTDLLEQLDLPDPGLTLKYYEDEYLLKVTPDNLLITGLHPIRSQIIVGLLTEKGVYPWLMAMQRSVSMIPEADWEIFFLQALVDHQDDFSQIVDSLMKLYPETWTGIAGVIRCLLWAGIKQYVDENWETAEAARDFFGPGWQFIMDLNFTEGDEVPNIEGWWKDLEDLVSEDRHAEIERIRQTQTPKAHAFIFAKPWIESINTVPNHPSSTKDWASVAEVLYWAVRFGKADEISNWLDDESLASSVQDLSIRTLAELSYGLHIVNSERGLAWGHENKADLEARLARDLDIIAMEEDDNKITIHFITYPDDESIRDRNEASTNKSLHDQTIERLQIVRLLFPFFSNYGAQGYGHQIPGLGLDHYDDTQKTGVPKEYLPPRWPIWVNGIAGGLVQYRFRPDKWENYLEQIHEVRQGLVSCFSELILGVTRYFSRDKAINLLQMETIVNKDWNRVIQLANERPLLPKTAVDVWGMAQPEGKKINGEPGLVEILPTSVLGQIYTPYRETERKYFSGIANFMGQSLQVMVVNYHAGKLLEDSPQKYTTLKTLKQKGIKIDNQFLSFFNLNEAKFSLSSYQNCFRELFSDFIGTTELDQLEKNERDTLNLLWTLWYYYANHPRTAFANARKQAPARINGIIREFFNEYDKALRQFREEGVRATRLTTDLLWEKSSAYWIMLEIDEPILLYQAIESLILALRDAIGPLEYASIEHSLVESHMKYTVIIPTVRGKMINSLIWPLQTNNAITIAEPIEDRRWAYIPKQVSKNLLDELGIDCWKREDISLANQLSDSINGLALITSLMGRLNNIPDPTDAGFERVQIFMNERSEELSDLLQMFFDASADLVDKYNRLSEDEAERHPYLIEAFGILSEVYKQVLPSEDFNGEQTISLENFTNYSERLQVVSTQVENIKLLWISDILTGI